MLYSSAAAVAKTRLRQVMDLLQSDSCKGRAGYTGDVTDAFHLHLVFRLKNRSSVDWFYGAHNSRVGVGCVGKGSHL